MTNFERKRPQSPRWLPLLMLLVVLQGGCATYKPMRLVVDLQGSDPHAGLMEVHDVLLALGFVEKEIPPDVPSQVDRVYSNAEYWPVGASIDAFRQQEQLVVFLHQTDPQKRASPWVKETFQRVHEAVQEIFGPENVEVVEIHRSLR